MFFDTHNHSQFSFDGEGTTVEKSALAAVEKGFGATPPGIGYPRDRRTAPSGD